MWPKILIILCNIAHFLVYLQRLFFILFLVGIMLWYNKDYVNIIYNFNLINLNIYGKIKNSVFSRPRNIHHLQNKNAYPTPNSEKVIKKTSPY